MKKAFHEIESLKNETEFYKKQAELKTNFEIELQSCQLAKENEFYFAESALLHSVKHIAISLIRTIENAREIDVCAGMSTTFGYLTKRSGVLDREGS